MDVLDIMDAKRRNEAADLLEQLNVDTMSRTTDVEEFRKFVTGLQRRSGAEIDDKPAFDQRGFEDLRMRLKAGI